MSKFLHLIFILLLLPVASLQADLVEPDYPEPVPTPAVKKKAYNVAIHVTFEGLTDAKMPTIKSIVGRNGTETPMTNAKLNGTLFGPYKSNTYIYAIRLEGTDDVVMLPHPAAMQTYYYNPENGQPHSQKGDLSYPTVTYQLVYDAANGGRYIAKVVKIEYFGKTYEGDDMPSLHSILSQENGGVVFSLSPEDGGNIGNGNDGRQIPPPNVLFIIASALAGLGLAAFLLRLRARRRVLTA